MASTNPARMFSLKELGEIEQGKKADLILFQLVDNKVIIQKTFVSGQLVYSKD